jgi:transcriptional regulator GlxA family with amidase domain
MQVAFLLYERFTALDLVGPYEILRTLPGVEPVLVAKAVGPVGDERDELRIEARRSPAEVTGPDVLVVPGGLGSRDLLEDRELLDWIAAVHEGTEWTASVCTGALLLAAAGVLDGVEATTHWLARERLAELGARPVEGRVVRRGRVVTAAGVSAGIDMALELAALTHGRAAAEATALMVEYDPHPPVAAGDLGRAPAGLVAIARELRRRPAVVAAWARRPLAD